MLNNLVQKLQSKWYLIVTTLLLLLIAGTLFFIYKATREEPPSQTQPTNEVTVSEEQTPPQPVVIYGDSRTGHDMHEKIVNGILEVEPALVFHTGDLVSDGTKADEWATFNNITSELTASTKFYPALGNHEKNSQLYYDNFELPNNEQWYSVDYNGLHFIVLDSNVTLSIGSEQYNWLENDLEASEDGADFSIAIFHHPPISTGPHEEDEKALRQSIMPLFEKYGVDMAFSGHDHDYERSLYNSIYYIVAGGGGAPLYDQERTSPYSQKFAKTYHYCVLEVSDASLKMEVFDAEGSLIDEVEISE